MNQLLTWLAWERLPYLYAMRKFDLVISITEFENDAELNADDLRLLSDARKASADAYAPYSSFFVGAAIQLENGKIVTGNNQENVAYPSGLCAERVAIFSASANHPNERINAVAISCSSEKTGSDKPFSPCGSCRQVLAEYEQKQHSPIRIILGGKTGKILVSESVKNLLPLVFEAEELRK